MKQTVKSMCLILMMGLVTLMGCQMGSSELISELTKKYEDYQKENDTLKADNEALQEALDELKASYEEQLSDLKADYESGFITKDEYDAKVKELTDKYNDDIATTTAELDSLKLEYESKLSIAESSIEELQRKYEAGEITLAELKLAVYDNYCKVIDVFIEQNPSSVATVTYTMDILCSLYENSLAAIGIPEPTNTLHDSTVVKFNRKANEFIRSLSKEYWAEYFSKVISTKKCYQASNAYSTGMNVYTNVDGVFTAYYLSPEDKDKVPSSVGVNIDQIQWSNKIDLTAAVNKDKCIWYAENADFNVVYMYGTNSTSGKYLIDNADYIAPTQYYYWVGDRISDGRGHWGTGFVGFDDPHYTCAITMVSDTRFYTDYGATGMIHVYQSSHTDLGRLVQLWADKFPGYTGGIASRLFYESYGHRKTSVFNVGSGYKGQLIFTCLSYRNNYAYYNVDFRLIDTVKDVRMSQSCPNTQVSGGWSYDESGDVIDAIFDSNDWYAPLCQTNNRVEVWDGYIDMTKLDSSIPDTEVWYWDDTAGDFVQLPGHELPAYLLAPYVWHFKDGQILPEVNPACILNELGLSVYTDQVNPIDKPTADTGKVSYPWMYLIQNNVDLTTATGYFGDGMTDDLVAGVTDNDSNTHTKLYNDVKQVLGNFSVVEVPLNYDGPSTVYEYDWNTKVVTTKPVDHWTVELKNESGGWGNYLIVQYCAYDSDNNLVDRYRQMTNNTLSVNPTDKEINTYYWSRYAVSRSGDVYALDYKTTGCGPDGKWTIPYGFERVYFKIASDKLQMSNDKVTWVTVE